MKQRSAFIIYRLAAQRYQLQAAMPEFNPLSDTRGY